MRLKYSPISNSSTLNEYSDSEPYSIHRHIRCSILSLWSFSPHLTGSLSAFKSHFDHISGVFLIFFSLLFVGGDDKIHTHTHTQSEKEQWHNSDQPYFFLFLKRKEKREQNQTQHITRFNTGTGVSWADSGSFSLSFDSILAFVYENTIFFSLAFIILVKS